MANAKGFANDRKAAGAVTVASIRPSSAAETGGWGKRLRTAAAAALPSRREAAIGSLAWAVAMVVSAVIGLLLRGWDQPNRIATIAGVYAAGALIAFAPAIWLARLAGRGRSDTTFAATLLLLPIATCGLTAFLYGMQYRLYYSAWHDHAFTIRWVFEFVFTTLAAVYQFLVLGVRLYLPLGALALAVAAWWNAKSAR